MSTAQMTGRMKLDLYRQWELQKAGSARGYSKGYSGGFLTGMADAVARYMEKSDTPVDKAVGYGLCGFTLIYIAAHVLKAVF